MIKDNNDADILVSICCLVYNQEKYIERTILGFLEQDVDFKYEIIIHDDCSTDNTKKIIREYENKYPNIFNNVYETNNQYSLGIVNLLTKLYKNAKGKYIAVCEGDDYWTDKNKLQKQVEFLEKNRDYSACFHPVRFMLEDNIIDNDKHYDYECDISVKQIILGGGDYCATCSLCFKKEYALEFPKYRKMADIGDYPFQIMLSLSGKIHYFPQIMGVYRVSSKGSWTESIKEKKKQYVHWTNEIAWLTELDNCTNKKYTDDIQYRIVLCNITLYKNGINRYNKVKKMISKLKNKEQKKYLYRTIIKLKYKKIYSVYVRLLRRHFCAK